MRIVFLGDSLTWGGYGGNFVDEIAPLMPDHEIINAGVGGDTVVNLLRRLDDVLEQHEPEVIFVMVGGNDAVSYTMRKARPYYKHAKKLDDGEVTPEQFGVVYRQLLTQIQLSFVQVLVGLPPTEYNHKLVEANQIYTRIAREAAASLNVAVLDLASEFRATDPVEREDVTMDFIREIGERSSNGWSDYETERQRWGYTYTFDGMHLTPESARIFAERIAEFLKEHL